MTSAPFWEIKSLHEMTTQEWESLCDGCGRCCVVLLADDEEPEGQETRFFETSLCCQLFNPETRQCARYDERLSLVPGCVQVTPDNAGKLSWMPKSCAYRRLAEGRELADWHPLISGCRDSVVEAGIAVDGELTHETAADDDRLWDYVTGKVREKN